MNEIKVPSPGESVTEVTIAAWHHASGDYVNNGDVLFEIESDKATLTVSADTDGILEVLLEQGQTVKVGSVACRIDAAAAKPAATSVAAKNAKTSASPLAKKLMENQGLSEQTVRGTGHGGKITRADVEAAAVPAKAAVSVPAPASKAPASPVPGTRTESRTKMSALRQKAAQRLVTVRNQTAMLTTFNEVDMSGIMTLRSKYKESFKEKYSVGIGFVSFFVKAVCQALESYPNLNAFIENDEIVKHDFVDMGIAVSAERGLVVPVIRDANRLSFDQIESEIERLAARARSSQLTLDEMAGGTFTISNGGVFGSLFSTPILNAPQSGILGMHNIVERPVALNGQVVIRPMMYVAMSYDHRIIDGRESVGFLVRVKQLLEDPARLLLNV